MNRCKTLRGAVAETKRGDLGRIVLVGTYKGDQLTKCRGWYNYPVSEADQIGEADAASIAELWLFKGTKERKTYKAEVVGFIDVSAGIGGLHPWRVCA